jgi:predicted membrane protein DUF2231
MVNPFDLKTTLLAKHAQHVVLIHFPIALFIAAVAFDCIAQWSKRRSLADAAYYNLLVAAVSTVPVVATGVLAWQFQLEGQKLKASFCCTSFWGCVNGDDLAAVAGTFPRAPSDSSLARLFPDGRVSIPRCQHTYWALRRLPHNSGVNGPG